LSSALPEDTRVPADSRACHVTSGEGDEFKIVAESYPYGRYFSYQTYYLPLFMSEGSMRDIDVTPEFGVNAFRDLDAAVRGEKQGASPPARFCASGLVSRGGGAFHTGSRAYCDLRGSCDKNSMTSGAIGILITARVCACTY
jgi:hypothetical protein